MVDWYLPLKLVHVLSAIVAVGTNVTYFVWLAAMKDRPAGRAVVRPRHDQEAGLSRWRTPRTGSSR